MHLLLRISPSVIMNCSQFAFISAIFIILDVVHFRAIKPNLGLSREKLASIMDFPNYLYKCAFLQFKNVLCQRYTFADTEIYRIRRQHSLYDCKILYIGSFRKTFWVSWQKSILSNIHIDSSLDGLLRRKSKSGYNFYVILNTKFN